MKTTKVKSLVEGMKQQKLNLKTAYDDIQRQYEDVKWQVSANEQRLNVVSLQRTCILNEIEKVDKWLSKHETIR